MRISPQSYPHLSLELAASVAVPANGDELVIGGHNFPVLRTIHNVDANTRTVIVQKTSLRMAVQEELTDEINAIRATVSEESSEIDIMLANDQLAKLDINGKVEEKLLSFGFTA